MSEPAKPTHDGGGGEIGVPRDDEKPMKQQSDDVAPAEDAPPIDLIQSVELGPNSTEIIAEMDDAEQEVRILRKIDRRLVPLLSLLYLVSFVDRSNIGNAKIAGMEDDLELRGTMYNTALTLFFVPYALFEVPSNIVLKFVRPSLWISVLLLCWSIVATLMGIIKTYEGLLITRFFLGVAEAGFFPASAFLLTIWYRRYEVQRRMAVFYTAASLAGAFSGLLAFGIQHMAGIAGLNGWNWIFILEGIIPVLLSLVVWQLLPDNPETARFLTELEKEVVVNRLAAETGSNHGRVTNADRIRLHHVVAGFKDWRIWCGVVCFWANTIGVYGFTATVPTIIEQMGYTNAIAQLLTIPIYVVAMIGVLGFAWLSDKVRQRTPFIMIGFSLAAIGFVAELAIPHPRMTGVSYFFLYVVAFGLYAPHISLICLIGNNLAPSSKRAVGMAVLISSGNLGGICGSNIFLAREAPVYRTGYGVGLAMCCAAVVGSYILRRAYARENRRRDELMTGRSDEEIRAMYTEQELLDLGDRSPFFRYTL